ncbi:MAG: 2-C-methyl-D-erythritol 4-phosphate cytidylyltransferase [Rubrivivax sp. SCN 71-131]|nr:MAG: 2-C-methyl-D-erythritol 4-phosphate cytidylyltransferase [Rubrivivax sp. SCN 71-131]
MRARSGVRCWALVPCAGVGERAGTALPKQYAMLQGQPLVRHTLRALRGLPQLGGTLIVLSPRDAHFEALVPADEFDPRWLVRLGGATRAASVAAGLTALRERGAEDRDWVLVHDAARCLLRPQWIQRLIDAVADDDVGGLLALPLADTVKREDGAARVQATVPRERLWLAQTPQMFRLGLLQQALAQAGTAVTDEAGAIEALGHRPRLVPGEWENLKVTWPADFALAERLLATR